MEEMQKACASMVPSLEAKALVDFTFNYEDQISHKVYTYYR